MSLTHEFAVIEKGSNINCIDKSMDMVFVSDKVILYIKRFIGLDRYLLEWKNEKE